MGMVTSFHLAAWLAAADVGPAHVLMYRLGRLHRRTGKPWTQREAVAAMLCAERTWRSWESGEQRVPRWAARTIARHLNERRRAAARRQARQAPRSTT